MKADSCCRAAVLEKTGLLINGREGLALHAERLMAPMVNAYENGALFRVRIEASFAKARSLPDGRAYRSCSPSRASSSSGTPCR